MSNHIYVILCGGSGERLWPLSRKSRPKQFIPFLDGKSLLEQTIDLINCSEDPKKLGVITNVSQVNYVKQFVGDKIDFILQEPESKNTGPAILYSLFELEKKYPNSIIVFLPADSFVPDKKRYSFYLDKSIEYASKNNQIVILGSMPSRPTTGYGYIQVNSSVNFCEKNITCGEFYQVFKFHEKPDLQNAQEYLARTDMLWNMGVFVSKINIFLQEFKNNSPELYNNVYDFFNHNKNYKDIENISVDYSVIEKSKNIVVLPTDFEWYDIGNLDMFLSLQEKFSVNNTKIISIDGQNNIAKILNSSDKQEKIVSFIGVSDICLVQDKDVILVSKRSDVEKVKRLLIKIKEESLENLL